MTTYRTGKILFIPMLAATLALGLVTTYYFQLEAANNIQKIQKDNFGFQTREIILRIEQRLLTYRQVLLGGKSFFLHAQKLVTRDEFSYYIKNMQLEDHYPGIQGVGFSLIVPKSKKSEHIRSIRKEGFPGYDISPEGDRDIYTSIMYLEPFTERNLRAFGYDMYSEPVRHEAMSKAVDMDETTISGKVKLVQETEQDVQVGFLMYVPVYFGEHSTLDKRRANVIGWVYSPFRMNDLMQGILGEHSNSLNLEIYDGEEVLPETLMYSKTAMSANPKLELQKSIVVMGHVWTVRLRSSSSFIESGRVTEIRVTGIIISVLSILILGLLVSGRARSIKLADSITQELRDSENRWKFAIEGSGDGLWDWNIADSTVYYSTRLKEMLGFTNGEFGNSLSSWESRVHPDDKEYVMASVKEHFENKTSAYQVEHRVKCKDNSYKWILDRGMVVERDPSGKPLRMIGTHTDISERKFVEQTLKIESEKNAVLLRNASDGIHILDTTGNVIEASDSFCAMLSYSRSEIIGMNLVKFDSFFGDKLLEELDNAFAITGQFMFETRHRKRDGSVFDVEINSLHLELNGKPVLFCSSRNITERKQYEEQLNLAASVFTHAHEGIMITEADGTIINVNETFCNITGYSKAEVVGKNPRLLSSNRHDREFYNSLWIDLIDKGHWYGEIWNRHKNGRVYAEMQRISAVKDPKGNTTHYVALFSDITLLKEHEEKLEHIAHYDALTNLPNRVLLADRLQQAMSQVDRREQSLAVVFLDLDGFKAINDMYGHDAGDHLLMSLAKRMKAALREGDTLARLGGDEFVAVLLDLNDFESSKVMFGRLLYAASSSVHIKGVEINVSASLGVTYYPQTIDIDADQLMRQADQAMYQAKQAGKNCYHVFDTILDSSIRLHHENLDSITEALKRNEFVLYYQPKVNIRTGDIIGVEALIRHQHPDKGILPPSTFLPEIEDHPLIVKLGEWVINTALTQIAMWAAQGLRMPVSVNIAARQLQQVTFVDCLRTILEEHPDVDPALLELEILETSSLVDVEKIAKVILACREMGVKFALDDFGTGYSSLTYLKQLPIAMLKIDQSFVRDMLIDLNDRSILEGIIALSKAFHLNTIAEGVETVEHGELLLELGCDLAQGYGIARPMKAESVQQWSKDWLTSVEWSSVRKDIV